MNETTILITGASSGIGLELARLSAQKNHHLVLTARSVEALEKAAGECRNGGARVTVIPADLSIPAAVAGLFEETRRQKIEIDILVNNAGFGTHGPFWESNLEDELGLLQVNVVALVQLTRLVLPGMVSRGRGKVLNVASTAAFQPGPLMANYYASKAYVLSFTEALHAELKSKGITVTALCPGPTLTGFHERAKVDASRLFRIAGIPVQAVAAAGYRALMRGQRVCIPGMMNKLLVGSGKWSPRSLVLKVTKKLNESR